MNEAQVPVTDWPATAPSTTPPFTVKAALLTVAVSDPETVAKPSVTVMVGLDVPGWSNT